MEIANDIRSNDGRFPPISQPVVIGEYSMNRQREMKLGREEVKYIYPQSIRTNVNYDLSIGYDTFEQKEGDEKLDVLLQWITTQTQNKNNIKKVLHEGDIVSWRGLLTKISSTPYSSRDTWSFVAIRRMGIIFLCEEETDQRKMEKEKMTERDKLMSYWGFKFEQYITTPSRELCPSTSSSNVVSCREEFAVVVRTTLTRKDGRSLNLVYSGEVDAIDIDGRLVEAKTQRHALEGNFWMNKSMKWWIQSYLVGIRNIIVGYRNDEGFVKNVESIKTERLPREGKWSASVVMNQLISVLSCLYDNLINDKQAYRVQFDGKKIIMMKVKYEHVDFLSNQFLQHFEEERN